MDDTVERLQWLRARYDMGTKADAARAYGIPYEVYKKLEEGSRSLTKGHAERIAEHHRVSRGWLMFGEGSPTGDMSVPLAGFIGAGHEVVLFDDIGEAQGTVEAAIGGPDTVALEVRGDSMFPLARNGDKIFVGPPRRDLSKLIGQECAVQLDDGRRFFKILERGSKAGLYDLRSHNAAPMYDQHVHKAGTFLGLQRNRAPARVIA